jgi:hypothetical protein
MVWAVVMVWAVIVTIGRNRGTTRNLVP